MEVTELVEFCFNKSNIFDLLCNHRWWCTGKRKATESRGQHKRNTLSRNKIYKREASVKLLLGVP